MRITLIRPGRSPEGLIVPLGILYIAAYLEEKRGDVAITVIDAPLEDLSAEAVAERTAASRPDLVGLSGLTADVADMRAAALAIRRRLPRTTIIAGGPAVTSSYESLLATDAIDLGVLGEGEETSLAIVAALDEGRGLAGIAGTIRRGPDGGWDRAPERPLIGDVSSLPLPAYRHIDLERYFTSPKRTSQSPVYLSKRNLPIMTSRGCPFHCIYCHKTFGKRFRPRDADQVVAEIAWLRRSFGIEELEIIDDIFNFDLDRAKAILRGVVAAGLGLKIAFPNGIKYQMVDDEFLGLCRQAGVYRLAFGIESGNRRVQRIIRKTIDLERMREVIRQAADMGFFVSGFFQLGLPGETREEMRDTIDFALSTKLHTAMFHLTVPFPGTQIYEEHIRGTALEREFTGMTARDISINLSAVDDEELLRLKREAFLRFYFTPWRMWHIYRAFPLKRRLWKNFINTVSEILFKRWIVQT